MRYVIQRQFFWYHLAGLREENFRISIGDVFYVVGVTCIAYACLFVCESSRLGREGMETDRVAR